MIEDEGPSPLGSEMVAGLSDFCEVLESGVPIEDHFPVKTVRFDLYPKRYQAADIQEVRAMLGASQGLLAQFLGVSIKSVRSWERGTRPVPTIACRFLDEIVANPELWKRRLIPALGTKAEGEI